MEGIATRVPFVGNDGKQDNDFPSGIHHLRSSTCVFSQVLWSQSEKAFEIRSNLDSERVTVIHVNGQPLGVLCSFYLSGIWRYGRLKRSYQPAGPLTLSTLLTLMCNSFTASRDTLTNNGPPIHCPTNP